MNGFPLIFRQDYKEYSTNTAVNFIITMPEKELEKAEEAGLEKHFKLTTSIATTNMICFDFEGKIKKYTSPEEIIEDFYPRRLQFYQKRKVRFRILRRARTATDNAK